MGVGCFAGVVGFGAVRDGVGPGALLGGAVLLGGVEE
jgi:hypothetical protein